MAGLVRLFAFLAVASPTRRQRLAVSAIVAALSAVFVANTYKAAPEYHSDFGIAWFGGRAMLDGRDPYQLIGPGREFDIKWAPLYPATAMVAAMPVAALTEELATMGFVAISVFLLAYGITRDGWHLMPLFATEPFASSARLGQWSILVTAAWFLPWLASLTLAKPQAFLPILVASRSRAPFLLASIGGIALLLISLAFLPSWPAAWLDAMKSTSHMSPPIARPGRVSDTPVAFQMAPTGDLARSCHGLHTTDVGMVQCPATAGGCEKHDRVLRAGNRRNDRCLSRSVSYPDGYVSGRLPRLAGIPRRAGGLPAGCGFDSSAPEREIGA